MHKLNIMSVKCLYFIKYSSTFSNDITIFLICFVKLDKRAVKFEVIIKNIRMKNFHIFKSNDYMFMNKQASFTLVHKNFLHGLYMHIFFVQM